MMMGRMLHIQTFGCQMNKLDSQLVADAMLADGYELTDDESQADVILFNTCSVRKHAEDRVFSRLGALKALKKRRPEVVIGVIGCMAQRAHDEIRTRAAHVDLICGPQDLPKMPQLLAECIAGRGCIVATEGSGEWPEDMRETGSSPVSAFVSVMRGCDRFCSYCIVPYVRGRVRSRPMEDITREVTELVTGGARDITLLGQDINAYRDGQGRRLWHVLAELAGVEGLGRLWFVTSHPATIETELFETMAKYPVICPYLHLPAQSGSNRVLEAMNRNYTRARYLEIVREARETVPGMEVASDFIVGFPGETDREYHMTIDLLWQARFQNSFVFKYSPRPGTKAARTDDDVSWETKRERNAGLLSVQKEIMEERQKELVGEKFEVLVQGVSKRDGSKLSGRTRTNRIVAFEGGETLAGRFVDVRIDSSTPLTLFGHIEGEPS
jgi:tRNA-2-methylthio-N6-dimethylallyladenosine synthase